MTSPTDNTIVVRFTDDEWARLQVRLSRVALSAPEYARHLIVSKLPTRRSVPTAHSAEANGRVDTIALKIERLVLAGINDATIATQLNISRSMVNKKRRQAGMPVKAPFGREVKESK